MAGFALTPEVKAYIGEMPYMRVILDVHHF